MNKFYDIKNCNPYELHFDENNMLDVGKYDNTLILDLYDIFVSICYHDFFTPRDENTDNHNKLNITIPVNNIQELIKIKSTIDDLVKYMTNGEEWNINFIIDKKQKIIDTERLDLQTKCYENICLLSGGLDAFSGASNEVNKKTLFVSTQTNDSEIKNSRAIYEKYLRKDFNEHIIVYKQLLSKETHYTQRTRTLMFIANALIYADYFKIKTIKMYENGIMSLNPKFYFRRIVTKTTHPKTIFLINRIFEILNLSIRVINPYMYLTKTDVLNILPVEWKKDIHITKTCSKNHGVQALSNRLKGESHCGLCTACILRQIAVLNSNLTKYDVNYMLPANISSEKIITNYEKKISKPGKENKIKKYAMYKYLEKKSLLEYYGRYSNLIEDNKIYKYLDINPKYFAEKDYMERIDSMLSRFKKEIDNYMKQNGN